VTGRLFNKATGKGVRGFVNFMVLSDSKQLAKKFGYSPNHVTQSDDEGRFRLVAVPATGALVGQVRIGELRLGSQLLNPYKLATINPSERSGLTVTERQGLRNLTGPSGSVPLNFQNAC